MVTLGELVMILELAREGLTVSAIARQTGLDRKTVRRYIAQGLEPPRYTPRPPKPTVGGPYEAYLRQRVIAVPGLSARRLLREIQALGYPGGYTAVKDYLRTVRPAAAKGYEQRFETPPGHQAQVDFAHFKTSFTDEPGVERVVWLFSLVLGHSRMLWARFVARQDLATVLRCHIAAFEALGGVPARILYDRMKTAVLGEAAGDDGTDGGIAYNARLLDLATHYGFLPKACKPYRAKTKGKVERPFRYIRQDFFLGRTFRNLDDLNGQLRQWLDQVANVRRHATTQRIVVEHFAEERPHLKPVPAIPYATVLSLERRITKDGMVSVGGNLYSVPDSTRRRAVEVQLTADQVQILEEGRRIAVHPVLEGRGRRHLIAGHRVLPPPVNSTTPRQSVPQAPPPRRPGEIVTPRDLAIYDAIGRHLAQSDAPREATP
ncbi:IS21 family transposase [Nitrospirillum iridis]